MLKKFPVTTETEKYIVIVDDKLKVRGRFERETILIEVYRTSDAPPQNVLLLWFWRLGQLFGNISEKLGEDAACSWNWNYVEIAKAMIRKYEAEAREEKAHEALVRSQQIEGRQRFVEWDGIVLTPLAEESCGEEPQEPVVSGREAVQWQEKH